MVWPNNSTVFAHSCSSNFSYSVRVAIEDVSGKDELLRKMRASG